MTKDVFLVSLAPTHSSHVRRLNDAAGGSFRIFSVSVKGDKTQESIFRRIVTLKYFSLLYRLIVTKSDLLWLWGIDVCLIGSLVKIIKPQTVIVWDISDINSHFLGKGWKAAILRKIEMILIKKADCLFLTSLEFYNRYYKGKIDAQKVCVIENLLPISTDDDFSAPTNFVPFKIVYSGIFRSSKILTLIEDIARELDGIIVFELYGYPDKTIHSDIMTQLAKLKNVNYHGKFDLTLLPKIYQNCHLIFGMLDTEQSINESWLLPNRIYHAGAFGRPVIVNCGTFVGQTVEDRKLGITSECNAPDIIRHILNLVSNNHTYYKQLVDGIPREGSYFLSGQYRAAIENVLSVDRANSSTNI